MHFIFVIDLDKNNQASMPWYQKTEKAFEIKEYFESYLNLSHLKKTSKDSNLGLGKWENSVLLHLTNF